MPRNWALVDMLAFLGLPGGMLKAAAAGPSGQQGGPDGVIKVSLLVTVDLRLGLVRLKKKSWELITQDNQTEKTLRTAVRCQ
jgi:hypothetical protein